MNDYKVDIGKWLSRGIEVFQNNWGPLVGYTAVMFLVLIGLGVVAGAVIYGIIGGITGATLGVEAVETLMADPLFGFVGSILIAAILIAPEAFFIGGIFGGTLEALRTNTVSFGRLFEISKEKFGPFFFYTLVMLLFSMVLQALNIPVQYTTNAMPGVGITLSIGYMLLSFLIALLIAPVIYAPFMICDKRGSVIQCLLKTFKPFYRHYFMNILAWILFLVISVVGLIACCVGIFATAPLAYLMWGAAYEDIYKET